VDGVYSDDPKKNKAATRYDTLTYMDVLQRDLKVMDASAVSLARENRIPILVFSLHEAGGFAKVLAGTGRCTVIQDQ
jgi:uridylate kinase